MYNTNSIKRMQNANFLFEILVNHDPSTFLLQEKGLYRS